MAHSLELLLDSHSEAVVRSIWEALAGAGLPSQLRVKSSTNRPHITLIAAEGISPAVDDVLAGMHQQFPIDCVVGAPIVFGGPRLTLARLMVPSEGLLALHEQIFGLSLSSLVGEPFAHCRPGHWTPHVTLGRRYTDEEIGPALAVVNDLGGDIPARIVGLRRWDSDERVDHVLVG